MKIPGVPDTTLIVGTWYSTCNNCGRQTTNYEVHDFISGFGPPRPSCGVRFTHVVSGYIGPNVGAEIAALAPHLEYIDRYAGIRAQARRARPPRRP